MKYKLQQETKPKLSTFGKYKAVAVHQQTVGTKDIAKVLAVLGIMRIFVASKSMIMRKGLLFCLVGGLFSVLGCAMKKMPEGELVREGCVEQDSTGAFVLRAMKETYGPLFEKRLDAETMNRFRQIIEEEKMYKYKERYTPMMQVLDGWGWSFSAKFSDGSVISSHGENAGPRGDGLKRIRSYMQELVSHI